MRDAHLHTLAISIHAPAKGATLCGDVLGLLVGISIHAPAKGATSCFWLTASKQDYFNPRSREGSDLSETTFDAVSNLFQSTLPRRERRDLAADHYGRGAISIHAPAKGATADRLAQIQTSEISIHAPAKGATAPICA